MERYKTKNAERNARRLLRDRHNGRRDFYRAHLERTHLGGANLHGVDLVGGNLRGVDLSGADLSNADLSWADLSGADLSNADLYQVNLYNANLAGADLSGADLSWANLIAADLRGADLSGTTLFEANLSLVELASWSVDDSGRRHASFDERTTWPTDPKYLERTTMDGVPFLEWCGTMMAIGANPSPETTQLWQTMAAAKTARDASVAAQLNGPVVGE